MASCGKFGSADARARPPPSPIRLAVIYAAIGASDANGVGSSVQCVPLDQTASGMGYVFVTARQLTAQGFTVSLTEPGIPTAVIGRGFEASASSTTARSSATSSIRRCRSSRGTRRWSTIFAGVNEVNTITAALGAGAGGSDPNGYIDNQVKAFGTDYATLMNGIRDRAGAPRIVILNVPNMAGLPYLAGASAGAAAGGAARRSRHDAYRRQPAGDGQYGRHRSDVRLANVSARELLVGRHAPERCRLRLHGREVVRAITIERRIRRRRAAARR